MIFPPLPLLPFPYHLSLIGSSFHCLPTLLLVMPPKKSQKQKQLPGGALQTRFAIDSMYYYYLILYLSNSLQILPVYNFKILTS